MMTSIQIQPVTARTRGDALFHHATALPPVTCLDEAAVKHPYLLAVPRWRGSMVVVWCSLLLVIVYLQYASLQVRSYIDVVAWGSSAFQHHSDANLPVYRQAVASHGHRPSAQSLHLRPEKYTLLRQLAKQSDAHRQEQIFVAQHVVTDDNARLRHRAPPVAQLKPRS